MKYRALVVAALLLTTLGKVATAAETSEQPSKRALKTLVLLASMGVENETVKELVTTVDSRLEEDRSFRLAEERVADGRAVLYFQTNGENYGVKQLELKYTPDNSHFEYTARTTGVRANYRIKF